MEGLVNTVLWLRYVSRSGRLTCGCENGLVLRACVSRAAGGCLLLSPSEFGAASTVVGGRALR